MHREELIWQMCQTALNKIASLTLSSSNHDTISSQSLALHLAITGLLSLDSLFLLTCMHVQHISSAHCELHPISLNAAIH